VAFVGASVHRKDDLKNASRGQEYGIYFALCFLTVWGMQVFCNICHVTYCGVFGRWYHRVDGTPLTKSLAVACTTSFGSICFGSFLIAAVRALEMTISAARRDAQEEGNILCCVILLVLECVVACLGDILDYFSDWAYVQCAVRGVSFFEAARITYSMMTCANAYAVVQDLLINSVVSLGALLCGLVGCGVGAFTGWQCTRLQAVIVTGGGGGFIFGSVAGCAAASILSSGTKTILALWAENPEPLKRNHPDIHQAFENRVATQFQQLL